MIKAIDYDSDSKTLKILDQLLLPNQTVYIPVSGIKDAWTVIRDMNVRGAPAIAIVALLGLAVELNTEKVTYEEKTQLLIAIKEKCDYLCSSRPTAVNVRKESDRLVELASKLNEQSNVSLTDMIKQIIAKIENLMVEDVAVNKAIGDHGAKHFLATIRKDKPLNILTICNTGSLATSGYGTALGVIRSLHSQSQLNVAYCTETRPYNQGARLTAYELVQDKINGTLICDNMIAALMRRGEVDACVVGADRVVSNGDTANKIGTYQMSVLAKHHNVPFYVASPLSTIDTNKADGSEIPIEERPHKEMKYIAGVLMAPEEINCWNPAFDVTPAELITGIITEKGVITPSNLSSLFQ